MKNVNATSSAWSADCWTISKNLILFSNFGFLANSFFDHVQARPSQIGEKNSGSGLNDTDSPDPSHLVGLCVVVVVL